jgi:hypothetical protein
LSARFTPSGRDPELDLGAFARVAGDDPEVDDAWRGGIQTRFAANITEQRAKTKLLAEITREQQDNAPPDLNLLDAVPLTNIDITLLPEDTQRRLYDSFHLEVRYHAPRREAILRITIDAETAPSLTHIVNTALNVPTPRRSPETAKPAAGAEAPAAGGVVCDVLSAPGAASFKRRIRAYSGKAVATIDRRHACCDPIHVIDGGSLRMRLRLAGASSAQVRQSAAPRGMAAAATAVGTQPSTQRVICMG